MGGTWGRAVRVAVTAAVLGAVLVGPGATPLGAEEPGVRASVVGDPVRGGSVFTVELLSVDLPADEFLTINVSRNGVPVFDDPSNDAVEITCPAVSDPGEPEVTNRCSFLVRDAVLAGTYDLEIFVFALDVTLLGSATLDEDLDPWWTRFEIVELTTSIFTGAIDLTVRFPEVPAGVEVATLGAFTDDDGDGAPERLRRTIDCDGAGPGPLTCSTGQRSLPPLCTEDGIAGRFCDDAEYAYVFLLDGIDLQLTVPAVLVRLSRLEEGQFFARQDFAEGGRLGAVIDLDTFLLGSIAPCLEQNRPECFDIGYYTAWLQRYAASFSELLAVEGRFDVVVEDDAIVVDLVVPRLPVGQRGFSVNVRVLDATTAAVAAELDPACSIDECPTVVARDLPPGEYFVEVRLLHRHPVVDLVDENGDEVVYPSSPVFTSVRLPASIVVPADDVLECAGVRGTRAELERLGYHVLIGTPGPDVLWGTDGPDFVLAGDGNDLVGTYGGADVVCLGEGADVAYAAGGPDRVDAGPGDDRVFAGPDDDRVWGGLGEDRLHLGAGDDRAWAGRAADWVFGAAGEDEITGGDGPDVLLGGEDDDVLDGGDGPDVVRGGAGDDRVVGGPGVDQHLGAAGTDVCVTDQPDEPRFACEAT